MLESCDRVSDFKSNQLTYVGISTQDKGNSHPNVPFFSLNDQYNNSNLHTYVGIGTQDKWNSLQTDQLPHKIDRSIDHNHNTLPLINDNDSRSSHNSYLCPPLRPSLQKWSRLVKMIILWLWIMVPSMATSTPPPPLIIITSVLSLPAATSKAKKQSKTICN